MKHRHQQQQQLHHHPSAVDVAAAVSNTPSFATEISANELLLDYNYLHHHHQQQQQQQTHELLEDMSFMKNTTNNNTFDHHHHQQQQRTRTDWSSHQQHLFLPSHNDYYDSTINNDTVIGAVEAIPTTTTTTITQHENINNNNDEIYENHQHATHVLLEKAGVDQKKNTSSSDTNNNCAHAYNTNNNNDNLVLDTLSYLSFEQQNQLLAHHYNDGDVDEVRKPARKQNEELITNNNHNNSIINNGNNNFEELATTLSYLAFDDEEAQLQPQSSSFPFYYYDRTSQVTIQKKNEEGVNNNNCDKKNSIIGNRNNAIGELAATLNYLSFDEEEQVQQHSSSPYYYDDVDTSQVTIQNNEGSNNKNKNSSISNSKNSFGEFLSYLAFDEETKVQQHSSFSPQALIQKNDFEGNNNNNNNNNEIIHSVTRDLRSDILTCLSFGMDKQDHHEEHPAIINSSLNTTLNNNKLQALTDTLNSLAFEQQQPSLQPLSFSSLLDEYYADDEKTEYGVRSSSAIAIPAHREKSNCKKTTGSRKTNNNNIISYLSFKDSNQSSSMIMIPSNNDNVYEEYGSGTKTSSWVGEEEEDQDGNAFELATRSFQQEYKNEKDIACSAINEINKRNLIIEQQQQSLVFPYASKQTIQVDLDEDEILSCHRNNERRTFLNDARIIMQIDEDAKIAAQLQQEEDNKCISNKSNKTLFDAASNLAFECPDVEILDTNNKNDDFDDDAKLAARMQQEEDNRWNEHKQQYQEASSEQVNLCSRTINNNVKSALTVCGSKDTKTVIGGVVTMETNCQLEPANYGAISKPAWINIDDSQNDSILAAKIQTEWNIRDEINSILQYEADLNKAIEYQENEYADAERIKETMKLEEIAAMRNSVTGKALLLVNNLIEQIQETLLSYPELVDKVEPFATDDMVFYAEKLIQLQEQFKTINQTDNMSNGNCDQSSQYNNDEWKVDIGYHYTASESIYNIRAAGCLLTKAERDQFHINAHKISGSAFGDGVYTGNNPFAFHTYGNVGLIVARLQGKVHHYHRKSQTVQHSYNTVRGNKKNKNTVDHAFWDENVLQTSGQCLPMVRYDASIINATTDTCSCFYEIKGNYCILELHERLQKTVDDFLNDGKVTPIDLSLHEYIQRYINKNLEMKVEHYS